MVASWYPWPRPTAGPETSVVRNSDRPYLYLAPGSPAVFPDPAAADSEGLVAVGGDLSVARLMAAYAAGIFPWYEEGFPPMWWSPDPRATLTSDSMHVSRSLRRTWRRGGFELTWNRAFPRVMRECSAGRPEGTWILGEMITAYERLHREGHAFSLEVWAGPRLVGGFYGVQVGSLFAAESMFHRVTDASKIALVAGVHSLFAAGIRIFDVQFLTPHLASMGAQERPRADYLRQVAEARRQDVDLSGLALAFPQ